ncbi:MAG: IPT/TIG domain-containing protein, partial [Bryobacteraceae bacterium]|nr:IPT/TIG domain-containing protein [Bryobacteraceae bacterium]
ATTDVELIVTANEGWNFRDWGGLGFFHTHGPSRNPVTIPVLQSGLRYTARFTQSPVTRIVSQPPGLRVTVDGNTTTAPAGFAWMPGSSHTVSVDTATQNGVSTGERYHFASWSSGTERALTFQAGEQNSDVVARFDGEYRLTRVVSPTAGGSIAATPEQTFYAAGSTVELTANPAAGFGFAGWTGGAAGSAESQPITVNGELTVAARFRRPFTLETAAVVHAASFEGGAIAPGEIITIFGLGIGPDQLTTLRVDDRGRVATTLAETRVLIGGTPAPLIYASRNQVSAVVPYDIAGQANVPVSVEYQGRETNRVFLPVTDAAPAVFSANSSGKGAGAILNQDYSLNSSANPAERGSTVILYATGGGQTNPPSVDGEVTRGARNQSLPIRVRIGDQDAPFHYAGAAPDFVAGVMQLNVVVPSNLAPGVVPVEIRVGDKVSPRTITLAIR